MTKILHSQIISEGKPFLILHGFLGMGDNWKTLGKQFSEFGYQVHLIDQRNHGRSFHDDHFSYELMAKDLKSYVDHHQLHDYVLLGHSMGGKTAMKFAASYPDDIKQLVIADIAPKYYPLHHQDILKALDNLDFSQLKSRGEAEKVIGQFVQHKDTRLFLLKNLYWKEKGKLDLRINLPVLSEKIEEIGRELSPEAKVETDTLFIRGGNSGYIEDLDFLGIKAQFPNAQLSTVDNAGHWLHAENPSEFFKKTLDFLLTR